MLKAEVNNKTTAIEITGTLQDICTDLSRIIGAINKQLSEKDCELGHEFRVVFTKGFMDGICFRDDREHMEHYLAEGDKMIEIVQSDNKKKLENLSEMLDDFINWLKEKNEALEKFNKAFEETEGKKDDEAE